MMINVWQRGEYTISTDQARLNLNLIYDFLTNSSYWAVGRKFETVKRSVENSLSFGIYENEKQVGFGRVVTDYATFAWVADVFVLEEARGQGLGTWLVEVMLAHPRLQGFRRWSLATKDAHEIYRKFGFSELKRPERWMERRDPSTEESPDYWKDETSA